MLKFQAMCGRAYETYTDEELYFAYLNKKPRGKLIMERPNYNLCPTQLSPVILVKDGERIIDQYRFGLVPSWAKSVKEASKYSLINAKGEEIVDKRSYKAPFEKRRCIIPLSGFFEWKREGSAKIPFAIHLKENPIMSIAGVYENWIDKETGEHVNSFSIITCEPNSLMEKIHNRMPVILSENDLDFWLDPNNQDVLALQNLLRACPSNELEAYEISKLVNSPKNNSHEVLKKQGASY